MAVPLRVLRSRRTLLGKVKWPVRLTCSSYTAFLILSIAACANPSPMFPPAAVKDLDPDKQMGIFAPEADAYFKGHLAQVGGRIVAVEQAQDGVLVKAAELPLNEERTGVIEAGKSGGWFLFSYHGQIEPAELQKGNKFILLGLMEGRQRTIFQEVERDAPYLVARCLHIWETGRYRIEEFPNLPDGYHPLKQQTYCLPSFR